MRPWQIALRRMPAPAKAAAKRVVRVVDPALVAAYRMRTGERHPVPPFRLRVVGVRGHDIRGFLESGAAVAKMIETTLEEVGRPLEDFQRVLDFGCGSGRVISRLSPSGGRPVLHGSDVDREAVAWASRHFPRIRFSVNADAPPLAFPDGHFDLIYSISIFTHLDEASQDAWLRELDRVLEPGGVALLTTNGNRVLEWFRHSPAAVDRMSERLRRRSSLDAEGFIFEPYQRSAWNRSDFRDVEERYGLSFHSEDYIRHRWADVLSVDRHLPAAINAGQDLVVLSKHADREREGSLSQARPSA